jgi:hypothetical protein
LVNAFVAEESSEMMSIKQLAGVCILVAITGCSGPPPGVTLNTVRGDVELPEGKTHIDAADHALIQFHPKDGEGKSRTITGTLIEGQYTLMTEENGEKILGAPEGDYVVTITSPKSAPHVIPSKYSDPKTTDLTAHVDEGNNEVPTFVLKR